MTPSSARRIVMVAAGDRDRASSRLRVHAWADRFRADGIGCSVLTYYDPSWMKRGGLSVRFPRAEGAVRAPGLWRRLLDSARGADSVLLQEVVPPVAVTRELRRLVARLVVDLSDPIHSPDGPGRAAPHRFLHRHVLEPRLVALVQAADVTTVENDRVGAWVAGHGGRVAVVRGPVDTERYVPAPATRGDGPVTLGWTGSSATLPYLEQIRAVVESLQRERSVRLVLFGVTEVPAGWEGPVEVLPWSERDEPAVVAGFDVGLNPVPVSSWGRLRGGAKLMTYMASGVPTVSSDGGIADQVLRSGATGFVVRSDQEWRDTLVTLVDNPALRSALGKTARVEAVARYSYSVYRTLMDRILLGDPPAAPALAPGSAASRSVAG